jgi:glucokinase
MDRKYVLAADLGGTNLRIAAVDGDGSVINQRQTETPQRGSAEDIAEAIAAEARICIDETGAAPLAFGVAAAALIDSDGRSVLSSPNLHQLDECALADDLSSRLQIPVILENDATAAAIGELWLGASRNIRSSICVTLGTGVGGGLILEGRPYRGVSGTAGEVGHICVEPDGFTCGCGSHGCLEQYASGTAIARIAKELSSSANGSELTSRSELTAEDVYDAGLRRDPVALETFRRMGRYLGIALADLIDVLNPEMIVIGGGAAGGWDLFIDHVRDEIRLRAFKHPAQAATIVRAELGNRAGFLGAAWVALERSSAAVGSR